MKALIVIDVDKDELGEAVATITTKENDITFFARGVIRPLPTKADVDNVAFKGKSNAYRQGFISGYNCCVDEISGEW